MRVTVLIANHNYSKYVANAIRSALNQTVKPTTICVVDDCSTDNSWEIISSFAEKNQREEKTLQTPIGDILLKIGEIDNVDILAIRLPSSSGPSEARNVGISITHESTDIYAILDADDEMLENKIEVCLEPFANEAIGVVYANYYNINSETGVRVLEIKEPYDIVRLSRECIVHSGSLIRTSYLLKVFDEFGFYDRTMRTCEDFDLWLRLARICSFYHVAEPLTNVLVHPNNSTNSVSKDIWQSNWQRIAAKHFNE